MLKHTPGRWRAVPGNGILTEDGRRLAGLSYKGKAISQTIDYEELEGNAVLMAAAPELAEEHAEQIERMEMWLGVLRQNVDGATNGWGEASGINDVILGLEISIAKARALLARINGEEPYA
jgi:hypothetical protein